MNKIASKIPLSPVRIITLKRNIIPFAEFQSLLIRRPRERARTQLLQSPNECAIKQQSPIPTKSPKPIPARPLFTFSNYNNKVTTFNFLQNYTVQQGFTIISKGNTKSKKRGEEGIIIRVDYYYIYGSIYKASRKGVRNISLKRFDYLY